MPKKKKAIKKAIKRNVLWFGTIEPNPFKEVLANVGTFTLILGGFVFLALFFVQIVKEVMIVLGSV